MLRILCLCFLGLLFQHGTAENCMKKCMATFSKISERKELKPLYVVLTDVDLDTARRTMREACTLFESGLNCIRKCPGGNLVSSLMERNGLSDLCIKKRDDFIEHVMKCEVEHRDEIRNTCGMETLQTYSRIMEGLKVIMKRVAANPNEADSPEFRKTLGEVCEYTQKVGTCSVAVYRRVCSSTAQELTIELLKKSMGTATPEQLNTVSPKCKTMAEALQRAGELQSSTGAVTTIGTPLYTENHHTHGPHGHSHGHENHQHDHDLAQGQKHNEARFHELQASGVTVSSAPGYALYLFGIALPLILQLLR